MKCPVCQARFRGVRVCSRCGADLERLMRLAVQAWRLRESARRFAGAGDFGEALALVEEAQGIQRTSAGDALRIVCEWLGESESRGNANP